MSEKIEMNEGVRKELKTIVEESIKNILEHRGKWEDFLNNYAIDCTVEKYVNKNPYELSGFSVLLGYGGPYIEWILHRGKSYVLGSWGNESVTEYVDVDVAYEFLDYIEAMKA